MTHHWAEFFPEIDQIQDSGLKEKVMKVYDYAAERGGWKDLKEIPFSLLVETDLSYVEHVRSVASMAIQLGKEMKGLGFDIDMDVLIAGALLHDVGKLLEYEKKDGKIVKSEYGKHLRHPISGTTLADRFGLDHRILNIIAGHSKEGDHGWRSNEAIIVHHADFVFFDIVKASL